MTSEQERCQKYGCDPLLILEKVDNIAAVQKNHGITLGTLCSDMTEMKVAIGKLEVKAGIWGAVAGAFTAAVALFSKRAGAV